MIGRCKDCKWWVPLGDPLRDTELPGTGKRIPPGVPTCAHPKIIYMAYWAYNSEGLSEDTMGISDDDGYVAYVMMGPEFGCVHWEEKAKEVT